MWSVRGWGVAQNQEGGGCVECEGVGGCTEPGGWGAFCTEEITHLITLRPRWTLGRGGRTSSRALRYLMM